MGVIAGVAARGGAANREKFGQGIATYQQATASEVQLNSSPKNHR